MLLYALFHRFLFSACLSCLPSSQLIILSTIAFYMRHFSLWSSCVLLISLINFILTYLFVLSHAFTSTKFNVFLDEMHEQTTFYCLLICCCLLFISKVKLITQNQHKKCVTKRCNSEIWNRDLTWMIIHAAAINKQWQKFGQDYSITD